MFLDGWYLLPLNVALHESKEMTVGNLYHMNVSLLNKAVHH